MSRTPRELTGFTTMVVELIQSADDMQTATCLRTDVRDESTTTAWATERDA